MVKDKNKVRLWFIIPILIGLSLLIIGIFFILSGVFIETPIMNSENWFNLENTKLSRIYLGVFVGSVGLLVIGLMTPTYFFVDSRKNKQNNKEYNLKNKQLNSLDTDKKNSSSKNILQEDILINSEDITTNKNTMSKDKIAKQNNTKKINKSEKNEKVVKQKEQIFYDDDDIEILDDEEIPQDKRKENLVYDDDDIEILDE